MKRAALVSSVLALVCASVWVNLSEGRATTFSPLDGVNERLYVNGTHVGVAA